MENFCNGDLDSAPILVLDAAASSKKTLDKACDKELPLVFRLSRRFKVANETVRKAWEEDRWNKIGVISDEKKAACYRSCSFNRKLGKNLWRVIVVHSSALENQKKETGERNLKKAEEKLHKAAKKLAKKKYETKEEARKAAEDYLEQRTGMEKLIDCKVEIISNTIEKYTRSERPTPDSKKIKITT